MTQPATRVRLLALMAAVFLTACGDHAPAATPSGTQGAGTSVGTPPGAAPTAAASTAPKPAGQPAAPLTARGTPLPVGDLAPAFDGLPDGPAVLVFYRGHW